MATVAERNNNPGNLILNGIVYQGQTGVDNRGFAVFSSEEAGARAADLNLQTYAKKGFDTIHEIIYGTGSYGGWSQTDQAAYQDYLSKNLGIDPNQHIDLTNPTVRSKVLAQIFNFESGTTRYSQGPLTDTWADIQQAVNSGNPIDIANAVIGGAAGNVTNVITGAVDAVGNGIGYISDTVDNAAVNFVKWLWDNYGIQLVVGTGAILLVLISSWGLVKNTAPVQAVRSAAKTGATLAMAA